jgi:methionyl-tRNA formyltransferase
MNVAFWGSTEFSLEILKTLHSHQKENKLNIIYVVTQSAKPYGRKKELKHNSVAEYCMQNEITLYTYGKGEFELYSTDGNKDDKKAIPSTLLKTDLSIVAAYGKIIAEKTLNLAKNGTINFHGSLLPTYRGAIPVQMTILNQDKIGGLTIIKMNAGMDTGDIISKYEVQVSNNETSGMLMDKLGKLSAKILTDDFDRIFKPETWKLEKQDESKATVCYERDFDKKNFEINYLDGVRLAHGKIMAANPEPKAWIDTEALNIRLPFLKMNLLLSKYEETLITFEPAKFKPQNRIAFHIEKETKKLYIELSDGFLEILQIQPEGKNSMDVRSFLNGYGSQINE